MIQADIEATRLIKAWTKNVHREGDSDLLIKLMSTIVEREARRIGLETAKDNELNPIIDISREEWDLKFKKLQDIMYEHYGWRLRERFDSSLRAFQIVTEAEVGDSDISWKARAERVARENITAILNYPEQRVSIDLTACPFCNFHSDEIEEIWDHTTRVHKEQTEKRMAAIANRDKAREFIPASKRRFWRGD